LLRKEFIDIKPVDVSSYSALSELRKHRIRDDSVFSD